MLAALKRLLLYFAFSKHLKTKPGEAPLEFIIAMPGASLLLLFWGLSRGYPLWTCFLAFLNKGFIRKSAVWSLDQISGIEAFVNEKCLLL